MDLITLYPLASSSIRLHVFFFFEQSRLHVFDFAKSSLFEAWIHLDLTIIYKTGGFKEYADKAKFLPPTTKDADKLILYGLYKQATFGPIKTSELE